MLGLYGGSLYIGIWFGGSAAKTAFRVLEARTVVGSAVVAGSLCMAVTTLLPSEPLLSLKVMLIVLRVGYGTAQAFVMCHVPMWIRRTAPRENRASWIGLYQAAIPMGVLVGYLLAALILCFKTTWIYAHTENWRMIFLIQVNGEKNRPQPPPTHA